MSYVVAIREYKYNDAPLVNELVKNGYLSNVNGAWCTALFKEVGILFRPKTPNVSQITFQLVVMTAAIMFIFVGVPFFYCLSAVPVVMLIIYVAVYLSFYAKATELVTARKPLKCWVAEVYLPFFFTKDPQQFSFRIVSNERTEPGSSDLGTYQKKVGISPRFARYNSATDRRYCFCDEPLAFAFFGVAFPIGRRRQVPKKGYRTGFSEDGAEFLQRKRLRRRPTGDFRMSRGRQAGFFRLQVSAE